MLKAAVTVLALFGFAPLAAAGEVSFYGDVADMLRVAIADYYLSIPTPAGGVMLQGLNTSLTCGTNGSCVVRGPSIVTGSLDVDLPQHQGGYPKPLQQQIYEAVLPFASFQDYAPGASNLFLCRTYRAAVCDNGYDVLSVAQTYDPNDFDLNAPSWYSAHLSLVPVTY